MANEYQNLEPDRIKHLEMIQAVVARLANEAALIRGWALTVSSAFFGFAAQSLSSRVAAVGILPVLAFWGLNAYYLRAERQYRNLFDRVRNREVDVEASSMDARCETVASWWRTIWSRTLSAFYGVMFVVGAVLIIAGICKN
jgi:hypothetical protein